MIATALTCFGIFCVGAAFGGKLQRWIDADTLLRCRTIPEAYLRVARKPIDLTMWRIFTEKDEVEWLE